MVPWRKWYKTAEWQRLRWDCLTAALFTCVRCGFIGESADLVADHIRPHRGERALFFDPRNLQCLCTTCHNRDKQREERASFQYRPDWVGRSAVPLTLVAGPPCSGKSTYVLHRYRPGDVVIDLDQIACDLAGLAFTHDWDRATWLGPAMRRRNEMVADLARRSTGHAYAVAVAPRRIDRDWWRGLGAEVVMLDVPADECLRRAAATQRDLARVEASVRQWWAEYQPD